MTQAWQAPTAPGPVTAAVTVPGSKSITNRALLLAALADGGGTLTGALRSRDTDLMVAGLRALGVPVDVAGTTVRVGPHDGLAGPADIDCGLAGTVMRFVPPAAALAKGDVRFDGDPHARLRPMGTVLRALRDLGAEISGDALPFTLHGNGGLRGGAVTIDASASSQFVSALLLSGARYERGVTVHHEGKPVPSMPHIEMTVQMVRAAGAEVDDGDANTWRIAPSTLNSCEWTIEPDLSNATVFLAAAAATGGTVTVPGWPAGTTQPGDGIRPILSAMGCAVTVSAAGLTVTGPDRLAGVDVDMHDVSELAPTVAALAALAGGRTQLRGIAHIRGHETDRLAALVAEINGIGGGARETADGLVIEPAALHGGTWHAYADHRMATAGAVIGLVVPGIEVDDIGATSKTMPHFPDLWAGLLEPRR